MNEGIYESLPLNVMNLNLKEAVPRKSVPQQTYCKLYINYCRV